MTEHESDVVERITLAPDAGLVNSLGANHTLESAIADLVDNSLDAGATRVAVRLLTKSDRLTRIEVLDDGKGMPESVVNSAMTIGYQRTYEPGDLGHFGMGLKAASFAHSDVLTVWSCARDSEQPVGRRIRRADFSRDFTCEVLSEDAAAEAGTTRQSLLGCDYGTSVIWSSVRNAYRGTSAGEAGRWLAAREMMLRAHLGVTFHRLLSSGRIRIWILVEDAEEMADGLGVPVIAIDPFGYARSGHLSYPKRLIAAAGESRVTLDCHIWPARSDVTGFRIGGKKGQQFQGFYIYRQDRLLQIGGWSETANATPARQLARVVIDDSAAIGPFVTMNPEKSGLKFEPIFHDAINRAAAEDRTTFIEYLETAESVFAEGNRRRRSRKPAIKPEKGLPPALKKQIGRELAFIDGESVDIKWRQFSTDDFFEVDLPEKVLWLNSRYRRLFAPSGGSLNDAPVLKALMYLLTHQVFEGQMLGSRDKDEIALWKSVLTSAVASEADMRESE